MADITPQDLGKKVVPDDEQLKKLIKAGDPVLSATEAEAAILDRLNGLATGVGTNGAQEAATLIAAALPRQYLTAQILLAIDLRPYLMALDGTTSGHTGQEVGSISMGPGGAVTAGTGTHPYTLHTKGYAEAETARIQQVLVEGGANPAGAASFPSSKAGVSPLVALPPGPNDVQTVAGYDPVTGEAIFTTTAEEAAAAGTGMNVRGLRALVEGGMYDIAQLASDEAKYQQTVDPTAYFPIAIERGTARQIPDTVGVLDAINYLDNLTPDEIHRLQLKLAAGGYFDRLPNGPTYLDSDAHDKQTRDAWKLLVTDAVATNRPAYQVLGEAATSYRDQVRKQRLSLLAKYDPSVTAAVANDYSQSVAGRDLTPDERSQLDQHLIALVNQRAGFISGAGERGTQLANNQYGFDEDDVRNSINADVGMGREQRMINTQALNYKLKGLMH